MPSRIRGFFNPQKVVYTYIGYHLGAFFGCLLMVNHLGGLPLMVRYQGLLCSSSSPSISCMHAHHPDTSRLVSIRHPHVLLRRLSVVSLSLPQSTPPSPISPASNTSLMATSACLAFPISTPFLVYDLASPAFVAGPRRPADLQPIPLSSHLR